MYARRILTIVHYAFYSTLLRVDFTEPDLFLYFDTDSTIILSTTIFVLCLFYIYYLVSIFRNFMIFKWSLKNSSVKPSVSGPVEIYT